MDAAIGAGLETPKGMEECLTAGKRIVFTLTDVDRLRIEEVLADDATVEHIRLRARILLLSDGGTRTTDVAATTGASRGTVSRTKHDYVEHGIAFVLTNRIGQHGDNDIVRQITLEIAKQAGKLHEQGATFRDLAKKFDFSPEGIRLAIERSRREDERQAR